jgi:hypothetical protein
MLARLEPKDDEDVRDEEEDGLLDRHPSPELPPAQYVLLDMPAPRPERDRIYRDEVRSRQADAGEHGATAKRVKGERESGEGEEGEEGGCPENQGAEVEEGAGEGIDRGKEEVGSW